MAELKTVAVIAYNAGDQNVHRTVNVHSTQVNATQHKAHAQIAKASIQGNQQEIVMASPTVDPNLPHIFISGYSGPL